MLHLLFHLDRRTAELAQYLYCVGIADFARLVLDLPRQVGDLVWNQCERTDSGSAYRGSNPCLPAKIHAALSHPLLLEIGRDEHTGLFQQEGYERLTI